MNLSLILSCTKDSAEQLKQEIWQMLDVETSDGFGWNDEQAEDIKDQMNDLLDSLDCLECKDLEA